MLNLRGVKGDRLGEVLERDLLRPVRNHVDLKLHKRDKDRDAAGEPQGMSDLIDTVIGPYKIVGRCGQGNMGEVYKAHHPGLEVYRALKFIRPGEELGSNFRDRFKQEARVLVAFRHQNIVQVVDFAEHEDRFYIVMEFIDGKSLKDLIAGGKRVGVGTAISLIKDIAKALDYTHQKGVFHRDVKPDNIMVEGVESLKDLEKLEGRHRTVLMDFGIARLEDSDGNGTGTGNTIGTPKYMAPEQWLDKPVGPFTDVYALTVILFELLTGKAPFEADDPFAVGYKVVNDPIPRPRSLNPTISKPMEDLLLKGSAKAPEARYQTAAEFIQALEQLKDPELRAPEKKNFFGRLFAGMAGIALGAMMMVGLAVWLSGEFEPEAAAAPAEEAPAIENTPETPVPTRTVFSGPVPKMVSIPGLSIRMGAYEVTFEEYDAYAAANGKEKPDDQGWGRGRRPVINVRWDDADDYVTWLSKVTGDRYRLPTEAEWELATRAGTTWEYWWGDEIGVNRANCDGCGSQWDNKMTAPVGSFSANPFGLYDVHGNVWEWTQGCFDGDCGLRVLRGGSWGFIAGDLRASARSGLDPAYRVSFIGFRVAQDL